MCEIGDAIKRTLPFLLHGALSTWRWLRDRKGSYQGSHIERTIPGLDPCTPYLCTSHQHPPSEEHHWHDRSQPILARQYSAAWGSHLCGFGHCEVLTTGEASFCLYVRLAAQEPYITQHVVHRYAEALEDIRSSINSALDLFCACYSVCSCLTSRTGR